MQYTALVDTHVPRLAACLGDANEVVRRQALALLANLLQKVSQASGAGMTASGQVQGCPVFGQDPARFLLRSPVLADWWVHMAAQHLRTLS